MLAQTTEGADVSRIIAAVAVLLGMVLLLALVLLKLRRRLLGQEDASGSPLTLHDLRQMHARGAMSDAEFEQAKAALIGAPGGSRAPRRPAQSDRSAPPGSGYSSTDQPPDSTIQGADGGDDG